MSLAKSEILKKLDFFRTFGIVLYGFCSVQISAVVVNFRMDIRSKQTHRRKNGRT